jgi:hypothetical protein
MPDERIVRAKRAEVQALVDEAATEGEQFSLDLNGLLRAGVTLSQLHEAANGDASIQTAPPDPKLLAEVVKRIELRRRLGLDALDCSSGDGACVCLRDGLDELANDERLTKRRVLARARRLHKERHPSGTPPKFRHLLPKPRLTAPVAHGEPAAPTAPVPAEVVTETQTRPFRRIRKTPRWYDGCGGLDGILGMRF